MFLEVTLHSQRAGMLEGRLEVTLTNLGEPLFHLHTQDLALTSGPRPMRLMTPPMPADVYDIEAKVRFVTSKESIPLGTFPIAGAPLARRHFVIAVCSSSLQRGGGEPGLLQALLIERFQKPPDAPTQRVTTSSVRFEPEDIPINPLAFCAFDMVLLEGRHFSLLREKQLTALARWVEGGGSLCVVASDSIRPDHLAFLNRLAGTTKAPEPFTLDEDGRLIRADTKMNFARPGLGRLVVTTEVPADEAAIETHDWERANSFLWKFQRRVVTTMKAGDAWRLPGPSSVESNPRREVLQAFLGSNLMPASTRLIPLPVIAAILAAFIIAVGPGEWLLLGWLRRRRWTWVTFPLLATGFTAITVLIAQHYLGAKDHRRTLTIVDLGSGGPVRESRIEMLFAARDKPAITDLRQSLCTLTTLGARNYNNYNYPPAPSGPPTFEGSYPAASTLRQSLRQWTPQINRTLSFEVGADESGLPWDTITESHLRTSLRTWLPAKDHAARFQLAVLNTLGDKNRSALPASVQMFRALSMMADRGIGSVLAQVSPTGDAELEDLAINDPSNPNEWTVLAMETLPDGNLRIYRRLYRTDD